MVLKKNQKYIILGLIIIIGGYLRACNLSNPLFSDSAFLGYTVRHGVWSQEQFPHLIILIWSFLLSPFHLNPDLVLRLPFILCGTLSIPAIYFVLNKNKWLGTLFIAFNPLFIFWSGLARPYAIAGLMIILAWKYKWFYIPALLSTPISLIGFNIKHKHQILLFVAILATGIFLYMIRPDIHYNGWDRNLMSVFTTSARWWYLPLVAFTLYGCDYIIPFLRQKIFGGTE